jgi:C-terminal processing protease CtpA/Prc
MSELSVPMEMAPAGKRTLPKDMRLGEAMAAYNGSSGDGAHHSSVLESNSRDEVATALGEDPVFPSESEAAEEATEPYQRYLAEPGRVEYFGGARNVTITQDASDKGFGLSIVAAQTKGNPSKPDRALFISTVKAGGAADRCGQIAKHDRLLAVNGIDVTLGDHNQVVGLIRGTGREVTLTVASRRKVKRVRDDRAADLLMAAITGSLPPDTA